MMMMMMMMFLHGVETKGACDKSYKFVMPDDPSGQKIALGES